jgi:hypothetical protein
LRGYRNQALIARSWLGSNAPNLQLFLIVPTYAQGDGKWRQVAAKIEADDRLCRKLVWLFDAANPIVSARRFLDRTFIARPWPAVQRTGQLDNIANFALPKGWEEAIENPDHDFSSLVEQLIKITSEEHT